MTSKRNLKTSFVVDHKHEAFYTGGQLLFTEDGKQMLCKCTERVNVLDVETGNALHSFGQEEDGEVTSFLLSPDNKILVLALHNLLLKQFDFVTRELARQWKAIHSSPISSMAFDSTSTLLATGSSDSTIKVWDVIRQYCTHNLKGHQGVISTVKYHPDPEKLELYSAGEDYNIRVWNLNTSNCTTTLEGHYSIITCLQFSSDAETLYSSSRDQVVIVWNLKNHTRMKTIPVYETVEAIVLVPLDGDYSAIGVHNKAEHFVTAGSKGVLRVWNSASSQCVFTQNTSQANNSQVLGTKSEDSAHNITNAIYCSSLKAIATVSYDHNISLFNLSDLSLKKQFAGYNDEILDIKYLGKDQSHIVVATNSILIKVFDLKTWDVKMLDGHSDIVLALDVYKDGKIFASSSKDNTIRLWKVNANVTDIQCIAAAYGHTKEILSLAFSRMAVTPVQQLITGSQLRNGHAVYQLTEVQQWLSLDFLVSASEDLTIKIWSIPTEFTNGEIITLNTRITQKAHDKDINSIVVSPNDKFVATGSQDKTAKLWSVQNLTLIAVFRGHKRGVWCVQFSPVDQCLATSSSDGSVKIWSLSDFTCVRTFEGHDALVLNVQFINKGMQLLTSGSDGLMKLWTIKTSECVKTFDEHQSKVWALTVSQDESQVITGGDDSTIIVWKDVTEIELEEQREKQVEFVLKEQELMNLIKQKKYIKALALAINLEQPFRVLTIMKEILGDPEGEHGMKKILSKLRPDQLGAVLRFVSQWNTNSKHCHVAQFVLMTVLQNMTPEDILKLPNAKSTLEGLLPYTEKHFERMNRLQQQSMFVQYTWNTMRLASELTASKKITTKDGSSTISVTNQSTNEVLEASCVQSRITSSDTESDSDLSLKGTAKASLGAEVAESSSSEDQSSDTDDKTKAAQSVKGKQTSTDVNDLSQSSSSGNESSDDDKQSDLLMMDVDEESGHNSGEEATCAAGCEVFDLSDVSAKTNRKLKQKQAESARKSDLAPKQTRNPQKASAPSLSMDNMDLEKENKVTPKSVRNLPTTAAKTDPSKRHQFQSGLKNSAKKIRKSLT